MQNAQNIEREREREMGNVTGRRQREDNEKYEEEDGEQKRSNSDLALLADEYEPLRAGGNACVLKSKDNLTILRISTVKADHAEDQTRVHEALPWFVPSVEILYEYDSYAEFLRNGGKSLERIMNQVEDCDENIQHFIDGKHQIRITRMPFIQGTTMNKFAAKFPGNTNLKHLAFRMLIGLYVLQRETGFEHGDMTGGNVMIAMPGVMTGFTPMLIDFDFAKFFPQISGTRDLGTYHLRPLEFTSHDKVGDLSVYKVRGAVDLWALGINLLGIILTGSTEAIYISPSERESLDIQNLSDKLDDEIVNQILQHFAVCAIHALLMKKDVATYPIHRDFDLSIDQLWPLESRENARNTIFRKFRQVFGDKIATISPDVLTLLKRLLHTDPNQRTFRGQVAKYFDMQCFAELQDKEDIITRFVRPHLTRLRRDAPLPEIGNNMMGQIRNIYALGLARCADCSAPPVYFDTHRENLVCASCSETSAALIGGHLFGSADALYYQLNQGTPALRLAAVQRAANAIATDAVAIEQINRFNVLARQLKQKALNDDIVIYGSAMNMLNNPHNPKFSTFTQQERDMLHYYASQGAIYRK